MRRIRKALVGLGCLGLLWITFGLVIAWADYSAAKKPMDEIVPVALVVLALWLAFGAWILNRVLGPSDWQSRQTFQETLEREHAALTQFMHGNTEPYKKLYSRSADATLANPFGGVARGPEDIFARLDKAASYYQEGDVVAIETIASEHSADLGYAIQVERLRARVGGRDLFDEVGLRTTTVFRREESGWRLVHRHADPAVELRAPESIV